MVNIVLDERAAAEDALSAMSLGPKPTETIGVVARYYYGEGYRKRDLTEIVEDFVSRCNSPLPARAKNEFVDYAVRNAGKRPLIDLDGIRITKGELKKINELESVRHRKLMFTLLCLAKYGNAVNKNNKNWVNYQRRDIFSMAEVRISNTAKSLLMNDLMMKDYIGFSNIVDNINVYVKIVSQREDDETEMTITDFRNLGSQYLNHMNGGYLVCEGCGLTVKRVTNNQKYCTACAANINRERVRERYYS